jgi:hypothetical protein
MKLLVIRSCKLRRFGVATAGLIAGVTGFAGGGVAAGAIGDRKRSPGAAALVGDCIGLTAGLATVAATLERILSAGAAILVGDGATCGIVAAGRAAGVVTLAAAAFGAVVGAVTSPGVADPALSILNFPVESLPQVERDFSSTFGAAFHAAAMR